MDPLEAALDAIRSQTNTIATFSVAGIGAILVTWASMMGVREELNLRDFKRPLVLAWPLLCFGLAVVLGYIIDGFIAGFLIQVVQGYGSHRGVIIEIADPNQYFAEVYKLRLTLAGIAQLFLFVSGMAIFLIWFSVNALKTFGLRAGVSSQDVNEPSRSAAREGPDLGHRAQDTLTHAGAKANHPESIRERNDVERP